MPEEPGPEEVLSESELRRPDEFLAAAVRAGALL
jgi:hypothetical protein